MFCATTEWIDEGNYPACHSLGCWKSWVIRASQGQCRFINYTEDYQDERKSLFLFRKKVNENGINILLEDSGYLQE